MKKTQQSVMTLTLLTAALLGCNSNNDSGSTKSSSSGGGGGSAVTTTTVTVTPSLGKILNAKVILRNAKTGTELGTGTTGTTGSAQIKAIKTTDPVVAEVQLPSGTQYYDEAKQALATVSTATSIRAALPALRTNLGITPLTELAYQAALKAANNEAGLTVALVNQANQQIKQTLAAGIEDILIPPTLIADNDLSDDITANNLANSYALLLAAYAKLGTGNTPMLDALAKLKADLNDGVFDGKDTNTALSYNLDIASNLADAINNYFKAIAQATAALKALYTDAIVNNFKTNFSVPISVVYQGENSYGALLSTRIATGEQFLHNAQSFEQNTTDNLTTGKWIKNANYNLSVTYNKETGLVQSVRIEDGSPTKILQCLDSSCTGLTVDLTSKLVKANNFKVAYTNVPNTAVYNLNGVLSIVPVFELVNGQAVTADLLNTIAGSYSMTGGSLTTSLSSNPTNPSTVNNQTCNINIANGKASISGGGLSLTTAPNANSVVTTIGTQKRFTLVDVTPATTGANVLDLGFINGKLAYASATVINVNLQTFVTTTKVLLCTKF
ncbi:hypothetical protein [Agitococcus lubricus]|uniref:Uncharacterized protein n=1 Tax=Agitococcus lubricus TaxID=1077255 RepID=A0A2T5IYT2_9GAMM|nr:hypothetical protein [Agitococcus lubricus]PTQ89178.1 hypothetical protein C8N29_10859 [Agitococcus lubricus]